MIIDFHTHVFPDSIAEKAISKLENSGGIKAVSDGTLNGLISSMKRDNIDISVVLPVTTSPKQFDSINRFAAEINGKNGLISFGGIHPDNDNIEEKLDFIKSLGLKGIKLHPDFQDCMIDDEKYIRIIKYALEIGLLVLTHAGLDISFPDNIHCPPKNAARMLEAVLGANDNLPPRIILAHLGGHSEQDKVEKHLAGKNVYFDLSYLLGFLPSSKVEKMIRLHGPERILFGSDIPWNGQKRSYNEFMKLNLSDTEREMILFKNAKNLLKI